MLVHILLEAALQDAVRPVAGRHGKSLHPLAEHAPDIGKVTTCHFLDHRRHTLHRDVHTDGTDDVGPRHKTNLDAGGLPRRQRNAFHRIADEHLVKDLVDDRFLLPTLSLHIGNTTPCQELRPDSRHGSLHPSADNVRNRRNRRNARRDFLDRPPSVGGRRKNQQEQTCKKCGG